VVELGFASALDGRELLLLQPHQLVIDT